MNRGACASKRESLWIADKHGTARVVVFGLIVYAAGVALMTVSPDAILLDLTAGVLCGVGIATSSFSIVMIAFGRSVPQEKRSFIFGIATAASSFGQFVFAPIGQGFIGAFGWHTALLYLALILALALPLTFALRGKTENPTGHADLKFMEALSRALTRLSPVDRNLVTMIVEGNSYQTVAAREGLTVGAVKVRLNRVRPFLRVSVGEAVGVRAGAPAGGKWRQPSRARLAA